MRKPTALRLCVSWLFCCSVLPALSFAQIVANKQTIISQARSAYYDLRREGLASFQCSIKPNWEILLEKERKANLQGADAAIKTLNELHFTVDLASDNTVKLTHSELSGQSQEMMAALKQIYGGMEQMTSGFFDTWKLFMLSPPFPEVKSEYQLEAKGPHYRLTYREDMADVTTTMGRDLAISDLQVITADFNSSIQPSFTKTDKGFLLRAYEASYQSQKPEEATKLKVQMDYQPVNGLQMLHNLNLSGTYGGAPFALELTLSDCQVVKQQ
jgi:hypothetical protein